MNSTIAIQNPLMQPINFNGQVYITSQRLHADYKSNSGEKYEQLPHFNRLIRSIEAYQNYIDRGDIVELDWKSFKNQSDPNFGSVKLLFEATQYKPIMLINATMQLALSHHLDDEISKSMSVAVNTQAANQPKALKLKEVASEFKAALVLAQLLGLQGNQAMLGADRATKTVTGSSPIALIGAELIASVKEKTITPTEIGMQIGGLSAQKINKILDELGFQSKIADQWQPTDKGKPYGEMLDTAKKHSDGTPVKQWKWFSSIVDQINAVGGV